MFTILGDGDSLIPNLGTTVDNALKEINLRLKPLLANLGIEVRKLLATLGDCLGKGVLH